MDFSLLRPLSFQSFTSQAPLVPDFGGKSPRKWEPTTFKAPVVGFMLFLMMVVAIGIEVALRESNKQQGFFVDPSLAYAFGSIQFIKSFFPTALVAPFALIWGKQDGWIRLLQPYLELANGNAPASKSLLADYVSLSKTRALLTSLKNRHWLVFASATVALMNLGLQPLAGSVLIIRNVPRLDPVPANVTSTRTLGLDPTFVDYSAFVAAAGFADAAVFHNLTDPPFVQDNFTVAEFEFPDLSTLNGTMSVPTTGIQTSLNCFNPDAGSLSTARSASNPDTLTVTAKWNGCTVTTPIDISSSLLSTITQYGVSSASPCKPPNVPSYILSQIVFFQPIMFWFWNPSPNSDIGNSQTRAVFCAPTINVYSVNATVNLTTNALQDVQIVKAIGNDNNVTGPGDPAGTGLNGVAFNGVLFNASTNPFIQARATATTIGVPGSIFQFATQTFGINTSFSDDNIFLNSTIRVYTQHLSIIAKSIYYIPEISTLSAQITSLETRLWVDALPAHTLSALLMLTAIIILWIFINHRRARSNLALFQEPGSLAFSASLVSSSNILGPGPIPPPHWSTILNARDDVKTTETKLKEFRFGLDQSGHIIVQGVQDPYTEARPKGGMKSTDMYPLLHKSRPQSHAERKHVSFSGYSVTSFSSPSYPPSPPGPWGDPRQPMQ